MQILATWWGDGSSLAGLVVGIAGFAITVFLILKSKSASEAACQAAVDASDRIGRALTLTDLSSAIGLAKEIMRSQGKSFSAPLLDRCNDLKILLVRIRAENPEMTLEHETSFQEFIYGVSSLEARMRSRIYKETQGERSQRDYKMLSEVHVFLESLTAHSKIYSGGQSR